MSAVQLLFRFLRRTNVVDVYESLLKRLELYENPNSANYSIQEASQRMIRLQALIQSSRVQRLHLLRGMLGRRLSLHAYPSPL